MVYVERESGHTEHLCEMHAVLSTRSVPDYMGFSDPQGAMRKSSIPEVQGKMQCVIPLRL